MTLFGLHLITVLIWFALFACLIMWPVLPFARKIVALDHDISMDRNFETLLFGDDVKEMNDLIMFGMKKEHFNINKRNPKLGDETPVLYAARLGSVESLKELLNQGANFRIKNDFGETPLIVASKYNQAAVVEFLLNVQPPICDVNEQCDQNGDTALLKAAARNNGQIAEMLLIKSQGVGMEVENNFGNTAARKAALNGSVDVLKVLKRYGADFTVKQYHNKRSLLMGAANYNRLNVIEYLLGHDPPLSDANERMINTERTPLMFACCNNKEENGYGLDAITLLLDKYGANINAQDSNGQTALMYAITNNNIKAGRLLIERHADATIADLNGQTPLILAAIANRIEFIDLLLSQQPPICDVDEQNMINGDTPLIATTHCTFRDKVPLDAMKLLVEKYNAYVNAMDNEGRTALYWACKHNRIEIVKFLLSDPVRDMIDVNISDCYGLTPALVATMEHNIHVLKCFEYE